MVGRTRAHAKQDIQAYQLPLFASRVVSKAPFSESISALPFVPAYFRREAECPKPYQLGISRGVVFAAKEGKSSVVVLPFGIEQGAIGTIGAVVADEKLVSGNVLFISHDKAALKRHYAESAARFGEKANAVDASCLKAGGRTSAYGMQERAIVFVTAEQAARDIESGRLNIAGFSLLISDETHAGAKKPERTAAKKAAESGVLRLAFSASCADSVAKIKGIISDFDAKNVEFSTSGSRDARDFCNVPFIVRKDVLLPSSQGSCHIGLICRRLLQFAEEPLMKLKEAGYLAGAVDEEAARNCGPHWLYLEARSKPPENLAKIADLLVFGELEKTRKNIENARVGEREKGAAISLYWELFEYAQMLKIFSTEGLRAGLLHIMRIEERLKNGNKNRIAGSDEKERGEAMNDMRKGNLESAPRYVEHIFAKSIIDEEGNRRSFGAMYRHLSSNYKNEREHPKIDELINTLHSIGRGTKALVFCKNSDQIHILETVLKNKFFKAEKLLGSLEERREALARFADGRTDILICSRAGEDGFGMNVDMVINYDQSDLERQSTLDFSKGGAKRVLSIINLITKGTADEYRFYKLQWTGKKLWETLPELKLALGSNMKIA